MSSPKKYYFSDSPKRPSTPKLQSSLRLSPKKPMLSPTKAPGNLVAQDGDSIKVAVRLRPGNEEESFVEVNGNTIKITPNDQQASMGREPKVFAFDNCFHLEKNQEIYDGFAREFLDHGFKGYNACVLAYGQTSSGKSHTIIGTQDEPGIVPRTCTDIFNRIEDLAKNNTSVTVRISFCEIYNEQVRDLLTDSSQTPSAPAASSASKLRVREGPEGTYVDGLSEIMVKSPDQVEKHLRQGLLRRATAATKMNNVSSRSHAVFSWQIRQINYKDDGTEEIVSRVRLVDLAGSERANATGAVGERLKEGSNINKSLVTLGRVISALAEIQSKGNRNAVVIPYRESVLTRLLQDSLGGNSKTAMIACVSPTAYDQSLGTLRYADQAKHITTSARVNHDVISSADADAKVEKMQSELAELQKKLSSQEEGQQLTSAMRFYEEQAAALEARCKSLESQFNAARVHNELMSGYLREVQRNQPVINLPANEVRSATLEFTAQYQQLTDQVSKWQGIYAGL